MEPVTQKLYEQNSNLKTCTATVLECEAFEGDFLIVLDQTVLFPEGGASSVIPVSLKRHPYGMCGSATEKSSIFVKNVFLPAPG